MTTDVQVDILPKELKKTIIKNVIKALTRKHEIKGRGGSYFLCPAFYYEIKTNHPHLLKLWGANKLNLFPEIISPPVKNMYHVGSFESERLSDIKNGIKKIQNQWFHKSEFEKRIHILNIGLKKLNN